VTLTLTASVAPRQDVRHHHSVYLTIGCNESCAVFAHGHLSLTDRHRHHLRLRSVHIELQANHSVRIAMALSHATVAAVRAARRARHLVQALVAVDVTAPGGAHHTYLVRVQLTYR
jgi:hypothetical protein